MLIEKDKSLGKQERIVGLFTICDAGGGIGFELIVIEFGLIIQLFLFNFEEAKKNKKIK